jgi:hypothetical protein
MSFKSSFIFILTCSIFLYHTAAFADSQEPARKMISVTSAKKQEKADKKSLKKEKLSLEVIESEDGVWVSVRYSPKKGNSEKVLSLEKQRDQKDVIASELSILLDKSSVLHEYLTSEEIKTKVQLDPVRLSNGEHVLVCELKLPNGKKIKEEVTFQVDASPVIAIEPKTDKAGIFDPLIKGTFFPLGEEYVGLLDIYLDERPLKNLQIKKEDFQFTKSLSELIGSQPDIFSLGQGTHLLTLEAWSVNNALSVLHHTFTVDAQPRIETEYDQAGKFQSLTAIFPKVADQFSAHLDIYFKHGVIFSQNTHDSKITITRVELEKAFKKHKHKVTEFPVDITLAARSANGAEAWQRIEFN